MNSNQTSYNGVPLRRIDLSRLEPNLSNILIIAIIIGKQRPKIIQLQGGQNGFPSDNRAVWNFTVRDSVKQYINVTLWGNPEQVFQANDKFSTGDVVELINPQVNLRRIDDASEKFSPMVTSPYKLILSDKSDLIMHPHNEPYKYLLHYPTKPSVRFVPIQNIYTRGESIEFVDILGAVRGINETRTVSTWRNETLQVREIEIFDHTAPSLKITLWEPDIINRSNFWKPRETLLFFTDLKIDWSNFGHTYIAKTTGRTIVTENPIGKEAQELLEYAQNAPVETFQIVEQMITSFSKSNTADEILSIQQVHDRINNCLAMKRTRNNSFSFILYAFVTEMDLDGLQRTLLVKCGHCNTIIKGNKCEMPECKVIYENEPVESKITFDIKVALSDHTGTLVNCKLCGNAAELALGCSAKGFASMSDDDKGRLKWKYLLEQCKVHVAVIFAVSQNPIISILHIKRADPMEVSRLLPVY
ncbi:hypothetical protein ABEB36_012224 [Hypothenemus hampei]|uniref:Meiosis-specific with OB domain-containing protein n=1 Tax=Hypothenemus hampei TaxID=57062 RepID=A0ABD1EAK2_HYPHA